MRSLYRSPNNFIRMRSFSTTVKFPAKSLREAKTASTISAMRSGEDGEPLSTFNFPHYYPLTIDETS